METSYGNTYKQVIVVTQSDYDFVVTSKYYYFNLFFILLMNWILSFQGYRNRKLCLKSSSWNAPTLIEMGQRCNLWLKEKLLIKADKTKLLS